MATQLNEQDILTYMDKYGICIEERAPFEDWCTANIERISKEHDDSPMSDVTDLGEALCAAYCEVELSTVYCEVCGHDWYADAPCPFH